MLVGDVNAGGIAVRAAAAAFAGDTLQATRQYELAEGVFRDAERSRVVNRGGINPQDGKRSGPTGRADRKSPVLSLPLGQSMAFVRVAMLFAANTAATLREAQRRCGEELRGVPGSSAPGPWHALAQALAYALDVPNARRSAFLTLTCGT